MALGEFSHVEITLSFSLVAATYICNLIVLTVPSSPRCVIIPRIYQDCLRTSSAIVQRGIVVSRSSGAIVKANKNILQISLRAYAKLLTILKKDC